MTHRAGRHFLQIPGPTNVPDRVLRAIDRTGDLPKDDNGKVPSAIVIGFTPS